MTQLSAERVVSRVPSSRLWRAKWADAWQSVGVWAALALLIAVSSLLSDHFLTATNIFNVLRQASMIAIIGVGATFVIVSGGIDLSVGSIVLLCGLLLAGMLADGHNLPIGIFAALAVGTVAGLANGVGVAFFRIPSFVMTLAGMTIYHGLAFIYSGGRPISIPEPANGRLAEIAGAYLFNTVPLPVVYVAAVFVAGYVVLRHTRLGVYIYALGGNEEASRLSGVNVWMTKLWVYAISGLCAGAAAVVLTSRARTGEVLAGGGYELDAIAAVVIGGTSLSGGRGGVWGTLAGTLILFILLNLFTMMNIHPHWQEVFKGLIIVVAVLMQYRTNRS